MDVAADRFSYHPDLREKIFDPLKSLSRTLTTAMPAGLAEARERVEEALVNSDCLSSAAALRFGTFRYRRHS